MKVKYFPKVSELSLWLAWNDAINAGEIPLEDQKGRQFLALGRQIIMVAEVDGEYGPVVVLRHEESVRHAYMKNGDPQNLTLHRAKKPLRLE
mgnify:CR=1 FL=1